MALYPLESFTAGEHLGTRAADGGLAGDGTWTGPVTGAAPFDWAVASWNGAGDRIEVCVRVRMEGAWSPWFSFGRWSSEGSRGSVAGQEHPPFGRLATDTLLLSRPADAYQLRVSLRGGVLARLWLAAAVASHRSEEPPFTPAWGVDLDVPRRSQMVYPGGGNVWCSPTSLAMVMAYYGHDESIPDATVPGVYDPVYDGHGNWPFNTAYAGTRGFLAYVDRFGGFADLERCIARRRPVIASVAYDPAWLPNVPIPRTAGHLLVVRGFTREGDVIVNDPAADDDRGVRRVYRRDLFRRAWLDRGGVVYVLAPLANSGGGVVE